MPVSFFFWRIIRAVYAALVQGTVEKKREELLLIVYSGQIDPSFRVIDPPRS